MLRKSAVSLGLILAAAAPLLADKAVPEALKGIGIDQNLNAQLDLSLPFHDESGATVPLGRYFHGKPVVMAFVYYRCPMLCTLVMNGMLRAARAVSLNAGQDYEIVAISIDPAETPDLAAEKKAVYLERYRRQGAENGWHFLTGDLSSIAAAARVAGFRYRYDPASKQFAHASGIMVLTPDGRFSRYFYGLEYSARDLRLALVEASAERIGTPVDEILLYCLHYDPRSGKYGLVVMNALRLGGAATLLAMGLFWLFMYRRRGPKEARS